MAGQKTPQQLRNARVNREVQALPGQAAAPFILPIKGLRAAIQNAPPVDPELGTAPDPTDAFTGDIPLMQEPQSPSWNPWKVGQPRVSQGGDMASSGDNFNVGGNLAGMNPTPPPSTPPRYRPNSGQSLSAIRGLAGSPYSPGIDSSQQDPTVQRYNLAQQFAGEDEDRIIANQRAAAASQGMSNPQAAQQNEAMYSGEADALKNLLGLHERDIAESPITQGIKEANDYRGQERQAILGGFGGGYNQQNVYENPIQAAGRSAREMEAAKINAPVEAQRVAGAADVEKQRIASQSALDVANSKSASMEAALQAAFATGKPIRSMNPSSGAFSFEAPGKPVQVNPGLLRDITNTRARMKQAGSQSKFLGMPYGGPTPEKVAYDSAVAAAFEQHPASPEAKELALMIGSNPVYDAVSTDVILDQMSKMGQIDISDMTPEERQQVDQLLYIARGVPQTGQ